MTSLLLSLLINLTPAYAQSCYGPSDCVSPAYCSSRDTGTTPGTCILPAEPEPLPPPPPPPPPPPSPNTPTEPLPPAVPVSGSPDDPDPEPEEPVEEGEEIEESEELLDTLNQFGNSEAEPEPENNSIILDIVDSIGNSVEDLIVDPVVNLWCWLTGCEE